MATCMCRLKNTIRCDVSGNHSWVIFSGNLFYNCSCCLDEVLLIQDTPQYITAGQVDMYIKTTNIYENIRLKGRFVLIQTHGNITTQELLNFGVYFF